jgi:RNA polymerase sigma factor (sigma-70 family)
MFLIRLSYQKRNFKNTFLESTISVAQKLNIPEIVRNYGNRLKGFIRKRVRSIEDTEDILQEVYFQLAETDRLMKPVDQIAAWLFTVARNRITDMYRKKKTGLLSDLLIDREEDSELNDISELFSNPEDTPEGEYLRSMVWMELEKALSELPPEQRMVFELNEMQGIPFKEIAEKTGEAVNTLISRKRYAVLFLRERLLTLYNEIVNN